MVKRCRVSRRPRTDGVTQQQALAIFARDGGCLAPRLGGSGMDCWGRLRIEHVKTELRMGRRGTLLGTICEGHSEPGTRAGYCWVTDKRNRQAMREYLLNLNVHESHVDPCGIDCIARVPVQ